MVRQGDAVLAGGWFLDLLVRRDGITQRVDDQREFDQAIRDGWLRPRGRGRQGGLEELTGLVKRNALEAHPFIRPAAPEPPAMQPLGEVPFLQPGVRRRGDV
jgi:hypothetical protein